MSFLRKSLFVTVGRFAGIFLNMIAGIIFARTLGPEGIGQFELFRSAQVMAVTLLALGLGNASIYFLNKLKIDATEVISTTLRASIIISVILFFGLVVGVYLSPNYFGQISYMGLIFFSIGASSLLNSTTLRPVLVARLEVNRMIIVDIVPKVVLLAFGMLMIITDSKRIDLVIMALGLGNTASFILLLYYFRSNITFRSKFDFTLFRKIFKYGIQLSASNLIVVLTSNVTIILLRLFQTDNFNNVGYYTRAVAIGSMVSIIPATIGPMLYSKWSNVSKEELRNQTSFTMRVSFSVSLIACAGIMFFSESIVYIMYGSEFLPAVNSVRILSSSLIFVSIYSVCNNLLASDGMAVITMRIFLGTFLIVTLFTWVLVEPFGIEGAAIAVLLGSFFTAGMGLYICIKEYNISLFDSLIIKKLDFKKMKLLLLK